MKYLAYLHILSSASSPSTETRGIPAALKFCLGLFKEISNFGFQSNFCLFLL